MKPMAVIKTNTNDTRLLARLMRAKAKFSWRIESSAASASIRHPTRYGFSGLLAPVPQRGTLLLHSNARGLSDRVLIFNF